MDPKITTYLVPIDFTFETENALMFALALAEKQAHKVVLLHIITNENERIAAEVKLSELVATTNDVAIEATVIIGNVLHDIGVIAEGIGASLIVMGTHGEVGLLSKILGSKTMRVLANSKVPIIIAQKETRFHTINTIVMTLDLEKESIQVVKHATKIGQLFDSKVVLVAAEQTDEFLQHKIELNLKLSRNYLNEHGLNTEIHLVSSKGYVKNLLAYCEEIGADMLAATYYQDSFFSFSEHLIKALATNSLQIPVMTFDGESTSSGSQFGFLTV